MRIINKAVLGQFHDSFRVERQMKHIPNLCHHPHHPLRDAPELRPLAAGLSNQFNQPICGEHLVVGNRIDTIRPALGKGFDRRTDISDRGEAALVLKGREWPGKPTSGNAPKEIQVTLVARPVNHRRAKNDCASIQELFGGKLRPSVCIAVGVCLARAEINKARGLGRRKDLFCQADIDVKVALLGGDFLEVVRLSCKMNDGINYRQLIEPIPGVERSLRYTIPLGGRDVERIALVALLRQIPA